MSDTSLISDTQPMIDDFVVSIDNKVTTLNILQNEQGMMVALTNYGARVVRIRVPDRDGNIDDVVLGYDSIQAYLKSVEPYFGATIGRCANRIANGKINIDNQSFNLDVNLPPNHLHGGEDGYHDRIWNVDAETENSITYALIDKDGVAGYPGKVQVKVTYTLSEENELRIDYDATTDEITVINLTNHTYFNLSGAGSGSIGGHLMQINANQITAVNQYQIPTGEFLNVENTPFNFKNEKPIANDWDREDMQIRFGRGFDHNFVLDKSEENALQIAAIVTDPKSGRILELETTEPGVQFYTANALSGSDVGREGKPYAARTAFCLETQHFPDSPNQPSFPSVVLHPDKTFESTTVYRFKCLKNN